MYNNKCHLYFITIAPSAEPVENDGSPEVGDVTTVLNATQINDTPEDDPANRFRELLLYGRTKVSVTLVFPPLFI